MKTLLRNVVVLFIVILVLSLIFNTLFAEKKFELKEYTIVKNDTLWSIANELSSNNENLSIGRIIYDIQKINKIENCQINIGQTIYIPIYEI